MTTKEALDFSATELTEVIKYHLEKARGSVHQCKFNEAMYHIERATECIKACSHKSLDECWLCEGRNRANGDACPGDHELIE